MNCIYKLNSCKIYYVHTCEENFETNYNKGHVNRCLEAVIKDTKKRKF
jgi:hypothetical protein